MMYGNTSEVPLSAVPPAPQSKLELLTAAAEACLAEGWAIIPLTPGGKTPLPAWLNEQGNVRRWQNGVHSVYSASFGPAREYVCPKSGKTLKTTPALQAWWDGLESNPAIALELSGLTALDIDEGIGSEDELLEFLADFHIPITRAIRSGRTSSFGVHLLYLGVTDSGSFAIQWHGKTVKGEIKSRDKYVAAEGSFHKSGNQYTRLWDTVMTATPVTLFTEILKEHPPAKTAVTVAAVPDSAFEGSGVTPEQFEAWAEKNGESFTYAGFHEGKQAAMYVRDLRCPWEEKHTHENKDTDFAVFIPVNGPLFIRCQHESCKSEWTVAGSGWKSYRAWVDARTKEKTGQTIQLQPTGKVYVGKSSDGKSADRKSAGGKSSASPNGSSVPSAPSKGTFIKRRASDVKPVAIDWLWEGRIVSGKLNLFAGHPGKGKGLSTMDIAARISKGIDFPDAKNPNGPKKVLIFSSEDAAEDTLVPRLIVAGANLDNVVIIEMVADEDGTERVFSIDRDLPQLQKELASDDYGLAIIDPVMNHLGDADGYKDQEVRRVLTPLQKLAEKQNVGFILVAHLNKKSDADLISRVGGGMGIVGVCRTAWMFTESKDDEGSYLMSSLKTNLGPSNENISYEIEGVPLSVFNRKTGVMEEQSIGHIVWGGKSKEVLTIEHVGFKSKEQSKQKKCEVWLLHYMTKLMAGNQVPAKDVYELATSSGYSNSITKRAYDKLGGIKPIQTKDGWLWQIPVPPAEQTNQEAV